MEKKLVVELNNLIAGRKFWDGLKEDKPQKTESYYDRGLVVLYELLKEHPEITEEDFKKLLHSKPIEFAYARKVLKAMPDLYNELKIHGAFSVICMYKHSLYMKKIDRKFYVQIRREKSLINRLWWKRQLKLAEKYRKQIEAQQGNQVATEQNDVDNDLSAS